MDTTATKPNLQAVAAEVAQLRDQLTQANYRYYILDEPSISDDDYDMAMRRLVAPIRLPQPKPRRVVWRLVSAKGMVCMVGFECTWGR